MHVEAWGWCHCCSIPRWHLCRFLGSELRSSCLYGNCFIITVLCSRPECVYVWYLIPFWGNSLCTRQRVTTSQDSVETVGREPPVRLFGRQHFSCHAPALCWGSWACPWHFVVEGTLACLHLFPPVLSACPFLFLLTCFVSFHPTQWTQLWVKRPLCDLENYRYWMSAHSPRSHEVPLNV